MENSRRFKNNEDGKVHLSFTLPFDHMKNRTISYSPKLRGTCKRTVKEGSIVICSPLTGFKNNLSRGIKKKNSKISSIRDTLRQVDSMTSREMISNIRYCRILTF
jgi:hypothetical protein